jgi:hypothetical protein
VDVCVSQSSNQTKKEDDEMQKPSVQSSGRISNPTAASELHDENAKEPLKVTQEAVDARMRSGPGSMALAGSWSKTGRGSS